jgi:hypothetical protein
MHLQIRSTSRSSRSTPPPSTEKNIKEFFGIHLLHTRTRRTEVKGSVSKVESLERVSSASLEWVSSLLAETTVGIDTGMSKLIVQLSLFVI